MEESKALTKQDTIAKLYSLRAGLSALSEIYDEAEKEKQQVARIEQKMEWSIIDLREARNILEDEASEVLRKTEEISREISSLESRKLKALEGFNNKKEYKKAIFSYLFKLIGTLLIVLIVPALIFGAFWGLIVWISSGFYNFVTVIVAGLLSVFPIKKYCTFIFGNCDFYYYGPSLIDYTKEKKHIPEYENKINELKDQLEKERQKLNGNGDSQGKIAATAALEGIQQLKDQMQAQKKFISTIYARFHATHQAMQREFSSFLDERDWGNVDLIIFNYETGRALDLRDALLQVDTERRNERLVQAVQSAGDTICTNIRRGFGELQSNITQQIRLLDFRIAGIEDSAVRQEQAISESNRAQNALLNKMSVSSNKLAEDVEQMRKIVDQRYRLGK